MNVFLPEDEKLVQFGRFYDKICVRYGLVEPFVFDLHTTSGDVYFEDVAHNVGIIEEIVGTRYGSRIVFGFHKEIEKRHECFVFTRVSVNLRRLTKGWSVSPHKRRDPNVGWQLESVLASHRVRRKLYRTPGRPGMYAVLAECDFLEQSIHSAGRLRDSDHRAAP